MAVVAVVLVRTPVAVAAEPVVPVIDHLDSKLLLGLALLVKDTPADMAALAAVIVQVTAVLDYLILLLDLVKLEQVVAAAEITPGHLAGAVPGLEPTEALAET